jgi:hypothetical protein
MGIKPTMIACWVVEFNRRPQEDSANLQFPHTNPTMRDSFNKTSVEFVAEVKKVNIE